MIPIAVDIVNDRMALHADDTATTIPMPTSGTDAIVVSPAGIQKKAATNPHHEKTNTVWSEGSDESARGMRKTNPETKTTAVLYIWNTTGDGRARSTACVLICEGYRPKNTPPSSANTNVSAANTITDYTEQTRKLYIRFSRVYN